MRGGLERIDRDRRGVRRGDGTERDEGQRRRIPKSVLGGVGHELVGDHHRRVAPGLVTDGDRGATEVEPVRALMRVQMCVRQSSVRDVAIMELGDRLARSPMDMGMRRQDKTGEQREHGAACRQRAQHGLSLLPR